MNTIPFGKYRDRSVADVAEHDAGYLQWLLAKADHPWVDENRDDLQATLRALAEAKSAALPPLTLTEHQQERINALIEHIEAGEPVIRLDGGAGYGKSYTVLGLLKELRARHRISAAACAVSYVATQVLAEALEPHGFPCATVARTLKQSKVFNDGKEQYVLTPDSWAAASEALEDGKALVVDECSMINDEIADLLISTATRSEGTLILVGDQHQLPPVKQDTISRCCLTSPVATLTVPMRYSEDSDLYQIEQTARYTPRGVLAAQPSENVVITDRLVAEYVSNYKADPLANHRMLLFRRQEVVDANNAIRRGLFGENAAVLEDGEQLMILRTSDYPFVENPEPGDTTRFYSGQRYRATDVHVEDYTVTINRETFTIPHYVATINGQAVRIIFAISENQMDKTKAGGPEYAAALSAATSVGRDSNNWTLWRRLMNDFVHVAYQYATSVHRAQGQTADYAYVVPRPLLSVPGIMGSALAYVALTRAKKRLTVKL